MIQMGAGQYHWPTDISENDMRSATQDTGWATKPFKAPTGVGIGIKMACPCGCHTVGVYHLVEKQGFKMDDQWFPKVTFVEGPTKPDDWPVINARSVKIRMWTLESVQSAYGPSSNSHRQLANKMASMIPGIGDFVPSPCNCKPFKRAIWGMIQHLNDAHHPASGDGQDDDLWSRERIADWLEALDADLVLDPEYKAPGYRGPSLEVNSAMVEQYTAMVSSSMLSLKSFMDEVTEGLNTLSESLSIPKPMLKVKDVHALSSAFLSDGEEGMAKVMAEKGITTMQVEEAFMQPPSIEKHDPCSCFICKIKKKTNQEES